MGQVAAQDVVITGTASGGGGLAQLITRHVRPVGVGGREARRKERGRAAAPECGPSSVGRFLLSGSPVAAEVPDWGSRVALTAGDAWTDDKNPAAAAQQIDMDGERWDHG